MNESLQDKAKQHVWWQKNKRLLITIAIIILVLLLVFTLAVSFFGWDWTGFTGATGPTVKPNEQYRPAKTLWDVLQLLIVPIILAIGGFWLNQIQKEREQRTIKEQAKLEHELTLDNQRETALQAYINTMSELLLEKKLRESAREDEVRVIARNITLTMLPRLDATRKSSVLLFLHESGLIERDKYIIDLREANLSGANLRTDNLSGANLRKTNLKGVDLWKTNLKDVTGITVEELEKQVYSLKDAIMPDGSMHL